MARLTDREIELIRNARRAGRCPWTDSQDLHLGALRPSSTAFGVGSFRAEAAPNRSLAEGATRLVGAMIESVRRARSRRLIVDELQRLDDHLLRDIGLTRDEIKPMATRLAAVDQAERGTRPGLFTRLLRFLRRQATIRDLRALDDRMLADIGIRRDEIVPVVDYLQRVTDEEAGAPALRGLQKWNLSRQAAGQMARLGPETLNDLGYVKGDVDWVPEIMAARRLDNSRSA